MSIPGAASPLFLTSAAAGAAAGYQINRSLRFERADDAYLSKTFAAGNRKTWTFSCWAKLSEVGTNRELFCVPGANPWITLQIASNNKFAVYWTAGQAGTPWTSDALFRDPSAWYHFVVAWDTTQSTASNRLKVYANGVQLTGSNNYPDYDTEYQVNSAVAHGIGGNKDELGGYLAEIHFVDGAQLAASDFGEYDSNNVWQPKEFSGSHNQGGSGTIYSNNLTTNTGSFASGYPATNAFDGDTGASTRANAELSSNNYVEFAPSTPISFTNGVYVRCYAANGYNITNYYSVDLDGNGLGSETTFTGGSAGFNDVAWIQVATGSGTLHKVRIRITRGNSDSTSAGITAISINGTDSSNILVDGTPGGANGFHLKFADNSSNAALGTDSSGNNNTWTVNNLDAGAAVPNKGFNVVTWTGDGSSSRAIKLGFQPDFLWIKRRDTSYDHYLWDSIRGVTKELHTNLDYAEGTATNKLASLDSDGFTVKNQNGVNGNGFTYVAWAWKAGGTASSNTDGTITSSVSASAEYGFSVVSFTGDGSGTDTIGHGLNTAPKLIILKDRDNANDWLVYTDQIDGSWDYLKLNKSDAKSNSSYTAAGSSVFHYGTDATKYIAYCFSEVSGFSKFGSWTGNESNNGPTITLGFKPRFVLFKRTDSSGDNWTIFDTARDSGTLNVGLQANVGNAEESFGNRQIVVSDTGFQVTSTGASSNANGGKYLYAAFADGDGLGIDSLIDTPTNYEANSGNNGGNYATWNPLQKYAAITLSNGNLDFTDSNSVNGGDQGVHATIRPLSGKFYWEMTLSTLASENYIGISKSDKLTQTLWTGGGVDGYYYYNNGKKIGGGNGNGGQTYGASFGVGDVIGVAVDWDNGKVTFYKNGSSQGDAFTGKDLTGYVPAFYFNTNQSSAGVVNFGQRPFAYTPPTGYKSLCTENLADPPVADGSTAFDVITATGNGAERTFTMPGGFGPDLVWSKSRSNSYNHGLFDTVRGATKRLRSNSTATEDTSAQQVKSFTSDGFVQGTDVPNTSGESGVYWAWDAGSSTVSNTDGSITSTVRANQSAGFSIVSYQGNGSTSSPSIGHGLNASLGLVIIKNRDGSQTYPDWYVKHKDIGDNYNTRLNLTAGRELATGSGSWYQGGIGNLTSSSVITFVTGSQSSTGNVNSNGINYIAYCFAPVAGFSAFGSYEGNGSDDGPFVFTGFKVAWLMIKNTSTSGETWTIYDSTRDVDNPAKQRLLPNSNDAESVGSSARFKDLLSNGFKIRGTSGEQNTSGDTYIYAAFAEHPFKTARAR